MSVGLKVRLVLVLTLVFASSAGLLDVNGETPSFLKIFKPSGSAEKPIATAAQSFQLTAEDGPWLILAQTFVGQEARGRADRLATEIRGELKLPAFIYRENFDFTGDPGLQRQASKRLRYANQYQYEAYAVLVGEYDSVEHPSINRDLKTLKSARLPVFQAADIGQETDAQTPVTTVKAIHKRLKEKVYGNGKKGPMSNAFVTRNPMLPEEFFAAPEIDSFVKQLNEDKVHTLLDCKGKYTVVVRTFEGYGTIVDGRKEKDFVPSMRRLDEFAADAAKMVAELRKRGEDAYQFHDRYRSLVTIGSFDTLGRPLPGGKFEYAPEIRRVMEKYSATNSQTSRMIPGANGFAANHVAMIPFDVQPKPIAVPKSSKRSLYSSAFRR